MTRAWTRTFAAVLSLLCVAGAGFAQKTADPLKKGFENPPSSARPRVWWHWMNGNITQEGVKLDLDSARVKSIKVLPKNPTIPLPGMKQQVAVLATYSNGVVRDVTVEAFVESSNTEVATVDKAGLVTAVRRGELALMARFEGSYAATTLVVMGDRSGFEWKAVAGFQKIS